MSLFRFFWLSTVILVLLVLTACAGERQPTPTAVPQPTATSSPTPVPTDTLTPTPTVTATFTSTPTPTNTPTATSTPTSTALPEVVLGDRIIVTSGDFSFQPAEGYESEVNDEANWGLVSLSGEADAILVNIIGIPDAEAAMSGKSDIELLDELVADFIGNANGVYELSDSYTTQVGTNEATSADVSGELFDNPFIGQAVFLNPTGSQAFFAIALSRDSEVWLTRGAPTFASMMESVQFLSGDANNTGSDSGGSSATSPCVIALDPTYGYTEANAIQVGGDAFDGPPRERAYLDNLLGPNGEAISYERAGSMPYGDTILDTYILTIGDTTTTLYLDEYRWSEPQAPVGFTCATAFPLSAP